MSDANSIAVIAVIGLLALVSVVIAIKVLANHRQLKSEIEQLAKKANELNFSRDMTTEGIHEIRSATMGVNNKVKELSIQVAQLSDKIEELQLLDPQTRLYSQASKMVMSGASVEDVMAECAIPRAEAELLFSMHKK